jgi:hypothetical protein
MPPNNQFDVTLPSDPYIESAFPALDRTMKRAIVSALDTGKLLPNDLKVSNNAVTPLKKVDVSGSGMIVSDGTGLWMLDAVSVTADVTVAGLNGLDTGVQAASTTYYVYVIFNGTTIGSLLSISNSAPTMPTGYTFKKRVGANTTDASTNFSAGWTSDKGTPTITYKKGSGAGSYTTTSTTYVDVDATNLAFVVTVPRGQKITMNAVFTVGVSVANEIINLALADGMTTLVEAQAQLTGNNMFGSIQHVFVGDGASHTFKLRWNTNTGTATMLNGTATLLPTMIFWMGSAN